MSRILAIDYGTKRVGLAVSDPLQCIATPLCVLPPDALFPFIVQYQKEHTLSTLLVGYPTNLNGQPTEMTPIVERLIVRLRKHFPYLTITTKDERLTSKLAQRYLHMMGGKRKQRRDKTRIDKMSATLLLQDYMTYPFCVATNI